MSTTIPEPAAPANPVRLFAEYLRVTGIAHATHETSGDPALLGKRVGLVNGSSWIMLWSAWFGRQYLPGAQLINVGNEAIQINFLEARAGGRSCPPQSNIDAVTRYARDVIELGHVDAVMLTCSTMNRAYTQVQRALASTNIPIVHIDQTMMRRAVQIGGRILVVGTHATNVSSTQSLLRYTAAAAKGSLSFGGVTVEKALQHLAEGDIESHNEVLANTLRTVLHKDRYACVVLAQLSMASLLFSFPDLTAEFGIPVLTSAQCGFEYLREILTAGRPSI